MPLNIEPGEQFSINQLSRAFESIEQHSLQKYSNGVGTNSNQSFFDTQGFNVSALRTEFGLSQLLESIKSTISNALNSVYAPSTNQALPNEFKLDLTTGLQALSVFSNPLASDRDKVLALAGVASEALTASFVGSIEMPESVSGLKVVDSAPDANSRAGFLLEDGSVVSKQSLINRTNAFSVIQAVSILTSNAKDSDKALALANIGVNAASANGIISQAGAGNVGTVLNLINAAKHFSEMNTGEQAAFVTQSADAAFKMLTNTELLSASGAASYSSVLAGAGSVTGIALGVNQAVDVFQALDDMNRSHAVGAGAVGLGMAGAGIGAGVTALSALAAGTAAGAGAGSAAFPVVGTAIGAVVGAAIGSIAGFTSSGKSSGQMLRDSWRDSMESLGIAQKIKGSHHLELADGTLYNVGRDGGSKLTNIDGTERHTFDIDWGNPLMSKSIPAAHLFVIATGLDPSVSKFGGFDRTVSQALNAAASNTNSVEGVHNNFRHMLEKAGFGPASLGLKIEILRQSFKISDQEYKVYISHINSMFGSNLAPIERNVGYSKLIGMLSQKGAAATDPERELLLQLTSPAVLSKNIEALDKRFSQIQ